MSAVAVGELRLRAPRRDAVPRVVGDLEDALRTATLPGQGGEIVVIRRLDLGRIPPGLSRQALARRIEARLACCRLVRWRPGVRLADADAVAFPGLVEAALARLLEPGADPIRDAALATVFGPAGRGPAPAAFPALLARVIALGAAPAGRFLIALEAAGRLPALAAALPEAHAEALRRRLPARLSLPPRAVAAAPPPAATGRDPASQSPPATALAAAALRLLPAAPPEARRILARALAEPRPTHRALLLAELVLHATVGPAGVQPTVAALLRAEQPRPAAPPPPPPPPRPAAPAPAASPSIPSGAPPLPAPVSARPTAEPTHPDTCPPPTHDPQPESPPQPDALQRTPFAGLFLLLPVFRLLALDDAESSLALPIQAMLLADFARRIGLAPDDPLAQALPVVPEGLADAPAVPRAEWTPDPRILRLLPAAAWHPERPNLLTTGRGRLVLGCRPGPGASPLAALLRGQALAVQVLARRLTGLGWRAIVRRPAEIACSRSHLDLTFAAEQVDLRLRRAGLDLDPGWTPFLGRVVAFHYDYSRPGPAGMIHHLPRWRR